VLIARYPINSGELNAVIVSGIISRELIKDIQSARIAVAGWRKSRVNCRRAKLFIRWDFKVRSYPADTFRDAGGNYRGNEKATNAGTTLSLSLFSPLSHLSSPEERPSSSKTSRLDSALLICNGSRAAAPRSQPA